MFNFLKKVFTSVKHLSAAAFVALFSLTATNSALAVDWDTTAVVKTISDTTSIVVSIGAAIISVVALTFGFRMMRSMLRGG